MDPNQPASPVTPQPGAQAPQPPVAPEPAPTVPSTGQPVSSPNPAPGSPPAPPTPSGAKKKPLPIKKIIVLVIVLITLGGFGFIAATAIINAPPPPVSGDNLVFEAPGTPTPGPTEHTTEDYPDFKGVDIGADTVSFNKVDESFQIKYHGRVFHEQDTGKYEPREVFPDNVDAYKWYGMVNPPGNLSDKNGEGDKLLSFKAPQLTYKSFVFIMRWDNADGEQYPMYRFHDNQISLLTTFKKDRIFYLPILREFSPGGTFISIDLFRCATAICTSEKPEVLLYHVETGETRNIGRVSDFRWTDEDNIYEYKPYEEGTDDSQIAWRRNDFFVDSKILTPNAN